jgi:hypothetical protein
VWLPLLVTLACASQPEGSDRVSFQGFHGVRFGMPVKQAVDAYGSRLAPAGKVKNADRDCYYVFPQDDEGLVGFMVAEGQIARIDVTRAGALSTEGFGVGSLESELVAAYRAAWPLPDRRARRARADLRDRRHARHQLARRPAAGGEVGGGLLLARAQPSRSARTSLGPGRKRPRFAHSIASSIDSASIT